MQKILNSQACLGMEREEKTLRELKEIITMMPIMSGRGAMIIYTAVN